ncbi:gibberellin 2-beta-dioxygenase 8 [Cucumis melo var. makuwa]|uniref:Gibberellin 2-beta-dioxygenase 8 n=2 Tax=Cucumis melo TaxID=3656 RepID=A0A5D3D2E7_CUCMM|nr:gibberellin 2-beta-dioxygenase 8 [Cucumis melo var. makuwa]
MSKESIEMCEELPVMDMNCCEHLSESSRLSLYKACNEWGHFYIKNHGVSKELYWKLRAVTDELLTAVPEEAKERKLKVGVSWYTPRFKLSPYAESFKFLGPIFSDSASDLGFTEQVFGHRVTQFRNLLDEYGSIMIELSRRIMKLLLKMMGDSFEDKFYESEFSNCNGYIRINRYAPRNSNEEIEAFGKHTDISCVTILFQDEIGGIQMKSKQGDEWVDVRPLEDALLVNIGDFLQAWSNERLRSAEHRVVLKQNAKRFTLGFFLVFGDDDRELYAPSEVVGEGNRRVYKPFSTKEYRAFRENNYGKVVGVPMREFAGIDLE